MANTSGKETPSEQEAFMFTNGVYGKNMEIELSAFG